MALSKNSAHYKETEEYIPLIYPTHPEEDEEETEEETEEDEEDDEIIIDADVIIIVE